MLKKTALFTNVGLRNTDKPVLVCIINDKNQHSQEGDF